MPLHRHSFARSVVRVWWRVAFALVPALFAQAAFAAPRCLSECTPRIGIVSAFGAEADLLLAQTAHKRLWSIGGSAFTTGELQGQRVVITLSGVGMVNAAMTTQRMLDHFRIERLIMSGIAGGVDPALHIGDVVVPERWAMPMEVYWNGDATVPAACGAVGDVSCLGLRLARDASGAVRPDFRVSTSAGAVPTGWYMRDTEVHAPGGPAQGEFRFDYEADPRMLAVARMLAPDLQRCGPKAPTLCVNEQPRLQVGGRAVSGNAFLANADYRAYLQTQLQAQAVDMETAALAQVAYANGVPFIAMRSVSDLAGGQDHAQVGAFFGSGLAEANEARVTLAFLAAWRTRSRSAN